MPDASKMVDGAGVAAVWNGIEEYVEAKAADIASILPTPRVSVTYADDHESAVIKVMNTWTGYGDVVVRCKLGGEPTEADTVVGASGLSVDYTYNGKVYIRAFSVTGIKTASGSSIITIKGLPEPKVFAVQWNYGNPSPALTRLTPTTDPLGLVTETITTEPVVATGTESGSSPFDAFYPWNEMKCRNFDTSGQPAAWDGESGFSRTNNDTMVWIPKFWIKVVDDSYSQLRTYYLADREVEGFTLHPGSGQYVGAYPTSNSKESKSGKTRQGSQNIVTMRTNARSKGAGWGLIDIAERNAIQFLYIIEFANWNSQNMIGEGPTSDYSTGYSDVIDYHTGVGTSGVVKYRHIEGLWRSQYEWTDGLNVVNGQVCVSTDRDNYQSNVTTGYDNLGSWSIQNLLINKLKYFDDKQWLIGIPEYCNSTDYNTYVGDDGYFGINNCALTCGKHWEDNASAGLFFFYAGSSSTSNLQRGSRLSYKDPSGGGQ